MLVEYIHTTTVDSSHKAFDLLEYIDLIRLDICKQQERDRKTTLGQFLTPAPVARLLASMLECRSSTINILDPGAGIGSLFSACVAALCARENRPAHIHVTAYEIDETILDHLYTSLHLCQLACERVGIHFCGEVVQQDFLAASAAYLQATPHLFRPRKPKYTCAILNPPYRKIHTGSVAKELLKKMGIESNNLYTGFLATAMQLLGPAGELVAITPRSFCNGPYFQPFREQFLETMSLRRLHVFDSRRAVFSDDKVLQENVIFHAVKSPQKPATVTISSTNGPDDELVLVHKTAYTQVVHPNDPQVFFHIVRDHADQKIAQNMTRFQTSLAELGMQVSTGRVVAFRASAFLQAQMQAGAVPLLFPTHVTYGAVRWPIAEAKKPEALLDTAHSKMLLVPNDWYVLVKRFSSKEEEKRLVAAVYDPGALPGPGVGFENHLNYFHQQGKGLDPTVARGLAAYLNSTIVDIYFRQFNGHTQVNATDLRTLRYPTMVQLEALGRRLPSPFPDQITLDQLIQEEFFRHEDDPIQAKRQIENARHVLQDLGFTRRQQQERSALILLALLNLKPGCPWSQAENPPLGTLPLLEFMRETYGKHYAQASQETLRRQTLQQFLNCGLIFFSPDTTACLLKSGETVYQIKQRALELFQTFETAAWAENVSTYLAINKTLSCSDAAE